LLTTAFSPTSTAVFSFQATLDGALYTIAVPWNVYRQNWYFTVNDQSNNLIVTSPLIGSPDPPEAGINLVAGYFVTSAMYYYPSSQTFVVTP
jgi:hypothetical protein